VLSGIVPGRFFRSTRLCAGANNGSDKSDLEAFGSRCVVSTHRGGGGRVLLEKESLRLLKVRLEIGCGASIRWSSKLENYLPRTEIRGHGDVEAPLRSFEATNVTWAADRAAP